MSQDPVPTRSHRVLGESASLFLGTLFIYGLALRIPFLWCDDYTLTENRELRSLDGLLRLWKGGTTDQYYPLTFTVYWLFYQVVGATAWVYHALNVLLHASTAILLLGYLKRLGVPGALWGAMLFAWHPLQVETVAWIYELKTLLAATLVLIAAHAHLHFIDRGRVLDAVAGTLIFGLALLAKSAVLVYPAVLGASLLLFPQRFENRRSRVWLLVAVTSLIAGVSAWVTIHYEIQVTEAQGEDYPGGWQERLALAGHVFWFYVGQFFWPLSLQFTYAKFDLLQGLYWGWALAGLVAIGGVGAMMSRRRSGPLRTSLATLALYALLMAPVLGFVNIYMMRYTYVADHLAYFGVGALGVGLSVLLSQARRRIQGAARGVAVFLVAGCAILSIQRTFLFADEQKLWEQSSSQSWLVQVRLGLLAKQDEDIQSAEKYFRQALGLKVTDEAQVNLANVLCDQGRFMEAIEHYRQVSERSVDDMSHKMSLGQGLIGAGKFPAGLRVYREILAVDPDHEGARANEVAISNLVADVEKGAQSLREMAQKNPNAQILSRLARVEEDLGHESSAVEALQEVLRLIPNHRPTLLSLVRALSSQANETSFAEAERYLAQLNRLSPDSAEAIEARLHFYRSQGRTQDALEMALKAVERERASGDRIRLHWFEAIEMGLRSQSAVSSDSASR